MLTTSTTTDPPRKPTTTGTTVPARTLATLTRDIALPWHWGPWAVDEFGYPSQFAVSYDGDHLFAIFPLEEDAVLPDTEAAPVGQEELAAFCQDRLREVTSDVPEPPLVSTAEPVRFFDQPAMLSTCVSPPGGPVEHAFVELFFDRGRHPWSWIQLWASNHEWDTIDARAVAAFAPVFREFVAAHSTGPAVTDSPPPPHDAIARVPPGAMCRDLHETGFSYREAVAYWMREGLPDRMDADRNGIPCETVYLAFAVELVYGAPQWLPVEIVTTTTGDKANFEASGLAVDSGVVCGIGTVQPFEPEAWGWAGDGTPTWTRANEYVCRDGSGTFVVGHRDHIADSQESFATWTLGVAGNGAYAWLSGGGRDHFLTDNDGRSQDHLIGRIAIYEQG